MVSHVLFINRQCKFETIHAMPHFPRLVEFGHEIQRSPSYHWDGRTRGLEPGTWAFLTNEQPHCIFQLTLSGQGFFAYNGKASVLPPGTGFLCESNDPLTSYGYPSEGAGQPWEFIYVEFSGSTAHQLVRDMVARYGSLYEISPDHAVFKSMAGMLGTAVAASRSILPSVGMGLVVELLCALAATQDHRKEPSESLLLGRAKTECSRLLPGRITASELALRLQVSRGHLSRVFHRQMRMSLNQYLQRRQMVLACQWLNDHARSVKDIAASMGFDSAANFVRSFRRQLGCTPTIYRETGVIPFHLLDVVDR